MTWALLERAQEPVDTGAAVRAQERLGPQFRPLRSEPRGGGSISAAILVLRSRGRASTLS